MVKHFKKENMQKSAGAVPRSPGSATKRRTAMFGRQFFARTSPTYIQVLRLNRLDAAKTLAVDYGWLRKACSVGLSRPNSRSMPQLTKIIEFFGLPLEELWTPKLLAKIWAVFASPEFASPS